MLNHMDGNRQLNSSNCNDCNSFRGFICIIYYTCKAVLKCTNAQQGFCKSGASVLNLSIGILINICAKLNICTSNSPPSQSPKALGASVRRQRHSGQFAT